MIILETQRAIHEQKDTYVSTGHGILVDQEIYSQTPYKSEVLIMRARY